MPTAAHRSAELRYLAEGLDTDLGVEIERSTKGGGGPLTRAMSRSPSPGQTVPGSPERDKMKRLASVVATACLVVGTVFAPIASSAAPVDPGLAAKATDFRRTFGLESDPAYVQRSLVDTAAFSVERYGPPLTVD